MAGNGDTDLEFIVGEEVVRGLGSFHKTLPHNAFGEVTPAAFDGLVAATRHPAGDFSEVAAGCGCATAALTNPRGGLATDRLTRPPAAYAGAMPPAPPVRSHTTAAEMTELYWMALLRDLPFDQFATEPLVETAAQEVEQRYEQAIAADQAAGGPPWALRPGTDLPGSPRGRAPIARETLFRLGLAGEDLGPLLSQFMLRDVPFGTQCIDQRQWPYRTGHDYLTRFEEWLHVQNCGRDAHAQDYSHSNENGPGVYGDRRRYISTPRDLARFVNKDALHQAYFNAAVLLLAGGVRWNQGNPYREDHAGMLGRREAGFGVLGGPHILALVSEVATRALKAVWHQKWQLHLRLRPEAYGGLVHVQAIGVAGMRRPYGLPAWVADTEAARRVCERAGSLLLPLAFTAGSPAHPAYGAGHATVAGACVTVLKAWFQTYETVNGQDVPLRFGTLQERDMPYGSDGTIRAYITGLAAADGGEQGTRTQLPQDVAEALTIEGELNKLAVNVAMGRSMGGVHWRTDNARSLVLGERLAVEILADITKDARERPQFEFRGFRRREKDGAPDKYMVREGAAYLNGECIYRSPGAVAVAAARPTAEAA